MNDNNNNNTNNQEELRPKDMAVEDLPEVRAFEDEFTRGFLQSTEETRPGYYPFLSGTGAYVIDFPEGGKIAKTFYNIRDQNLEVVLINIGDEKSDVLHEINIKFYGHLEEDQHKDKRLDMLRSNLGEKGDNLDFERIEKDQQIYHISEFESEIEEDQPENYGYAAFIFNNQGQGGIRIIYDSNCMGNCDEHRESDKESIFEWIKSVQFLEEPIGADENGG